MPPTPDTPWLTVKLAAARAQCGRTAIYYAIANGQLRAVRINRRRSWRIHREWLDAWLLSGAGGEVVNPGAPGPPIAFTRP